MRIRISSLVAWLGALGGLVVGASALISPRVRSWLALTAEQVGETAGRGVDSLRARMGTSVGRQRAALEELSETTDTATTQWESSMTVSKVAAALAEEPRLRGQNVNVRIIGGILHLEGEVRDETDRNLAAEISRRASGAQLIANDLTVASPIK